jgi:hypothetical protein
MLSLKGVWQQQSSSFLYISSNFKHQLLDPIIIGPSNSEMTGFLRDMPHFLFGQTL